MPRPAADEPDALLSGEAVDQIIAVRAILILADAPAEQRGVCEAGEAPRDIGARFGDAGRGELAFERVGVDRGAVRVEGDLESRAFRSEEHTSELQSLMRISYAVFCLKKKKKTKTQ